MRAGEVVDVELANGSSISIHIEGMIFEDSWSGSRMVVGIEEGGKSQLRRTLHASSGQRELNGRGSCSP